MADIPVSAWMQPFRHIDKIRNTAGEYIKSSDPCIRFDASVGEFPWVLHHTYGPAKPGAAGQGTGYPGIYQMVAANLTGPYLSEGEGGSGGGPQVGRLVISPFPPGAYPDECGNETFNSVELWGGGWFAMYGGYRFGSRSAQAQYSLLGVTGMDAKGPWTKVGVKIAEDPAFGTILTIAEPAIVKHSSITNRLEGVFNVRSHRTDIPGSVGTAHRTYRMWSVDDGATWSYSTTPIIIPEDVEESSGGFNAYTHSTLWQQNIGGVIVYHIFQVHSGRVSTSRRGITHRAALETDLTDWEINPNGTDEYGRILEYGPAGSEYETHCDTPTVWFDGTQWTLLFRGQNTRMTGSTSLETRGRPHLRYAVSP